MSQPKFPWRWLIFFLVTAVVGAVVYDVYTSKTVKGKVVTPPTVFLLTEQVVYARCPQNKQ